MTPDEITLVQESWKKVVPIQDAAAGLFYGKLFELDPELRSLFKSDLKEQGRKLMTMISMAVNGLSRLDTLVPGVQELGRRHAGYGVKDEHYGTVAMALVWTLEQGLGPSFTPSVKGAWVKAYTVLANTMREAAAAKAA